MPTRPRFAAVTLILSPANHGARGQGSGSIEDDLPVAASWATRSARSAAQ